ncbi:phosphodiester glycosidase family protein [Leptothoe kymatousa]|uniref:Phosphodiester glycosidase family protein n=1 Tax=Leptothoe kymatousa TAU-MAC 1615 TaxID=2364775 RepID=A0ABS5Y0Y5_9CYAN|nr:phosphodiester glycosidase family protein [Leptothoe kymatousa]MBT9311483.1 phosphodiester glycosidase family protein [Leptothoe kymatousa TAU-MAC 1615]
MFFRRKANKGLLWLGILLPIVLYSCTVWRRPQPTAIDRQPLFQGITYSRQVMETPRPYIVHIVDIDLTTPGLRPFVTPKYAGIEVTKRGISKSHKARAQRTSDFLETHQLQLAVNANFFLPFKEVTPWHYEPRPGQQMNLLGVAISDGEVVEQVNPINLPPPPSICFTDQRALINPIGTCAEGTDYAVAGNLPLLEHGQPTDRLKKVIEQEGLKPYSFTVAALDETGTRLWLVLVDGKQPFYSEGITLGEVTDLVMELGADAAVRLDGGGSTTLAMESSRGPKLLNTPIHAKVPGKERPVGNHLGFFAQPIAP